MRMQDWKNWKKGQLSEKTTETRGDEMQLKKCNERLRAICNEIGPLSCIS